MIPGSSFLCVAVHVTSGVTLQCYSGPEVLLAGVRTAATTEALRIRQRASLGRIVLGRPLRCTVQGSRGALTIARCTVNGQDVAAAQVATGFAEWVPGSVN
ncbi:hypothetical protein [Sphingomonas sp. ID0503]|uniref:hypothetical protein n=1 Tax=Sphingomonas sp. ID0503 TaxID=3399691 RepID=UPI003AFAABF9